jgi:hypothetical protein
VRHLHILCEGQTEEMIASDLLASQARTQALHWEEKSFLPHRLVSDCSTTQIPERLR